MEEQVNVLLNFGSKKLKTFSAYYQTKKTTRRNLSAGSASFGKQFY